MTTTILSSIITNCGKCEFLLLLAIALNARRCAVPSQYKRRVETTVCAILWTIGRILTAPVHEHTTLSYRVRQIWWPFDGTASSGRFSPLAFRLTLIKWDSNRGSDSEQDHGQARGAATTT